MKNIFTTLAMCALLFSCNSGTKKTTEAETAEVEVNNNYPADLAMVFEHHGGMKAWKSIKAMQFEMPKDSFAETHMIDLQSRRDRIETPYYNLGYDGQDVWLKDTDSLYKGNAHFYHNLMFYFYAMPFVLGDEGIQYAPADSLHYEDKAYPGYKITFNDGVGASSKDEYYLYFNPESHQMEWLSYMVTYFSNEKTGRYNFIRYNDWADTDGIKLPATLTWYAMKNDTLVMTPNKAVFENPKLMTEGFDDSIFAKPEGASVVTK